MPEHAPTPHYEVDHLRAAGIVRLALEACSNEDYPHTRRAHTAEYLRMLATGSYTHPKLTGMESSDIQKRAYAALDLIRPLLARQGIEVEALPQQETAPDTALPHRVQLTPSATSAIANASFRNEALPMPAIAAAQSLDWRSMVALRRMPVAADESYDPAIPSRPPIGAQAPFRLPAH